MGKIKEEIDSMCTESNIIFNVTNSFKILNMFPDTLIVLDRDNICVDISLKTNNPILNNKEDIVGKNFIDLLPNETAQLVAKELTLTRDEGVLSNANYDLPTQEGMYYFKLIIQQLDSDYLLCIYRDITKRSNMKGRLKYAVNALLEVGKVGKIGHWSYNPVTSNFVYFGYSTIQNANLLDEQKIPFSRYLEKIHPEDKLAVVNFLNKKVNAETNIEYRVILEDGKIEYLRSTRYVEITNGLINGFTQNISDFIKNRNELDMIVSVVNHAPQCVMAVRTDGNLIFANKTCRTIHNLTDNELTEVKVSSLFSNFKDVESWDNFVLQMRKSNDTYRFRCKDSYEKMNILETECICSIVVNGDGRDVVWIFQHDISDQIRYEEQLLKSKEAAEESEKLKMAFISNMNHEIRTPLSAILGFSSIIADTSDNQLRLDYAELIKNNSTQLLRLITDVLEMSKIDAGRIRLQNETVSLNGILQELKLSYKTTGNRAKLLMSSPQENVVVKTDRGRLVQLLTNLINNSIKFTPPTGLIEVGYTLLENEIEFYVKDNGIGIPEDKQKEIFNRFFKVNEADQGTGLGLAICKSIVEQMDGRIWVESKINQGTIFKIRLPLILK